MTVRWVRYASALVAWILLVSARCWGLSTKYSTKTTADYYLGDISFSVNTALRGDIFLKNNSHVMMVDFEGDTPGCEGVGSYSQEQQRPGYVLVPPLG